MIKGLRLIVCGGRDFCDRDFVYAMLDVCHKRNGIACVIHGAARGADTIAADWCVARGVHAEAFPADWDKHGKAAGALRNQRMLDEGRPDGIIAFPGGRGTADMVRRGLSTGVKVWRPAPR